MGALSRADGSAAVRIGGSHVTVAVFGPRPADARRGFEERAQIKATAQYAAFSGAPATPAKVCCCISPILLAIERAVRVWDH